MLTVFAHSGPPPRPAELWTAWNLAPFPLCGLGVAVVFYVGARARSRLADRPRLRWLVGAVVAIAVALVSPLDAMSDALASAHMVQHLLLVLVAAPLLARSSPGLLAARLDPDLGRAQLRWRRRLGLSRRRTALLRHPAAAWLAHTAVLWFWHAGVPYRAAVEHEWIHVIEHLTFFGSAYLLWRVVVGSRAGGRVDNGLGVLLLFGAAMQSVLLSALLTFSGEPWYEVYAGTTDAWGLSQLADQQLAGVIMWVPASVVYLVIALRLAAAWVRSAEPGPGPAASSQTPR